MGDGTDWHDARTQAANGTLILLEALEHDDVTEAIEALAGWAATARNRLAQHDVSIPAATGTVIGIILAALNEDTTT